ncbi:hypothetical protein AcV5_006586 [Taiwanofungus camphoratus]|nr:hypothetical protein AcV5_006586 [Antrodia cinnamomea]
MVTKKQNGRSRWPTTVKISLDDHIEHFKALNEDALQGEDENGFYHSCDLALNFNAARTRTKEAWISVHPQAQLRDEVGRGVLDVGKSDRVTRSAAAAGQEVVELPLPSIDNISAESSGVASDAPLPVDKSTKRYPDFIVAMKLQQEEGQEDRALFVVELKTLPYLWYSARTEEARLESLEPIFNHVLPQMVQQAQYTFRQYSTQDIVFGLCMIEQYFRVIRFLRSNMPEIGEELSGNLKKRWESAEVRQLLRPDKKDYSREFKTAWTKARHALGADPVT